MGDISCMGNMDAIVNTANRELRNSDAGVNRKIHEAAGPELAEECKKLGGCKIGEAKITSSFRLSCKYIIHTVAPNWMGGYHDDRKLLEECYCNSLEISMQNGVKKIAFPLIATGNNGFPIQTASIIAAHAVCEFLADHPGIFTEIVWVLYDYPTKVIFERFLLKEVNSKIPTMRKKELSAIKQPADTHGTVASVHRPSISTVAPLSIVSVAQKAVVKTTHDRDFPNVAVRPKVTEMKRADVSEKKETVSNIMAKDFVVRRAVFKCRHNNHNVQDIKAVFTTINRLGTVNKTTIPAGYCPQCGMYFIMESTYQRIKRSGVPICRTMDEKAYILNNQGSGTSSYSVLAQESVLKQFGYSVSQSDDLPQIQRKKILAAIVDNGVLTKSGIISYLDYFINNRKNQRNKDGSQKYRTAIKRWEDDRDFIRSYKTGSYKEVKIQRIVTSR